MWLKRDGREIWIQVEAVARLSLVLDEQFTVDDSESHNRYMYASVVVLLWGR
jgi:hypothetical protein